METIKVNMTPCDEVNTIHASQNDGEAREWGFELHNNGEKIDSSSISDQMVFKAYKGGTEQLLPENGSTPTTSPFKGDIKYPQGLLTDQEFTYRQSPTEKDGLEKITDIKGNTLNWNQLVENGNFASTSGWNGNNASISVSSNVLTATVTTSHQTVGIRCNNIIPIVANHKYLIMATMSSSVSSNDAVARLYGTYDTQSSHLSVSSTKNRLAWILQPTNTYEANLYIYPKFTSSSPLAVGSTFTVQDVVCFDLTQMGLDSITSVDEFTSLFSLPYYDYNQGTLLSFNGNGIKTAGKNLLNPDNITALNGITKTENGWSGTAANWLGSTDVGTNWEGIRFLPNVRYYVEATALSVGATWIRLRITHSDGSVVNSNQINGGNSGKMSILSTANKTVVSVSVYYGNYGGTISELTDFAIMISNSVADFEPYTSSTLSLPISTYFPSGMKSAGNVYDELTPSKAITRIGSVDLGSLNWQLERANYNVFLAGVQSYIKPPVDNNKVANIKCALYSSDTNNNVYGYNVDKAISVSSGGALRIRDTSFSDANTFKQSLSGVYFYYELATPTETSITTASLVTETTEIPLSNDDGTLIGKCTEQLSSGSGFFDAKIKLTDTDGDVYSNKIQLHVERKPS